MGPISSAQTEGARIIDVLQPIKIISFGPSFSVAGDVEDPTRVLIDVMGSIPESSLIDGGTF